MKQSKIFDGYDLSGVTSLHGLSLDQYYALLKYQNFRCPISGFKFVYDSDKKRFIDSRDGTWVTAKGKPIPRPGTPEPGRRTTSARDTFSPFSNGSQGPGIPNQHPGGENVNTGPSRGFFTNSQIGQLGSVNQSLDPATLAVIGIMITLIASTVQLVKGN